MRYYRISREPINSAYRSIIYGSLHYCRVLLGEEISIVIEYTLQIYCVIFNCREYYASKSKVKPEI